MNDWYLREWLRTLGVKQARIIELTDWPKSKMSKLVNGHRPYDRDAVNQLALILNLHPYELLMPPADAMAIRRLRDSAIQIAAEQAATFKPAPQPGGLLKAG